ncbi:hypothetical protein [Kitasatospora sp. LaBMicrA B282]|uniref:hypothetical protein n=1 Tax=Kitasatospora sp. LaBMicrA B282 TaxID=3420949 RepID=UPI003D0BE56E
MATLVVAGASEFLFVGIVGPGGSLVAAVLAGLLVNALSAGLPVLLGLLGLAIPL